MRPRHPDKHIEASIQYAESRGWRVELSNGHDWGFLLCPERSREGHTIGVYSTPKSPENHARRLRRFIDACGHGQGA